MRERLHKSLNGRRSRAHTSSPGSVSRLYQLAFLLSLLFVFGGCASSGPSADRLTLEPPACPVNWRFEGAAGQAQAGAARIANVAVSPAAITPAIDNGINDSTTLQLTLDRADQAVAVNFVLRDSQSCQLLDSIPAALNGGAASAEWDGRDNRGAIIADSDVSVVGVVQLANGAELSSPAMGLRVSDDICMDYGPTESNLVASGDLDSGYTQYRRLSLERPAQLCARLETAAGEANGEAALSVNGSPFLRCDPIPSGRPGDPFTTSFGLPEGGSSIEYTGFNACPGWMLWEPPPFPDPPPEGTAFDAQTCSGRLMGFEHPFGVHGIQPIERGGVVVDCVFVADVFYRCSSPGCKPARITKQVRARGKTAPDGSFSITIPESRFLENRVYKESSVAVEMRTECHPYECGYEARGSQFDLNLIADLGDGFADEVRAMDITDVLDVVVSSGGGASVLDLEMKMALDAYTGLGVSAEPKESERALLGARLLSSGTGAERNDLPLIVHEQIDVLNVEHSRFMVWAMSGQAVKGDLSANGCPQNLKRCVWGGPDCHPRLCGSGDVHCLAARGLQRLLDDGYDVWLVDHLQGRRDLMEIASVSPHLYEAISVYPSALSAPALPVDLGPHKRFAVGGLSLGSVVSRTALKLWEERGDLPAGIQGVDYSALQVPRGSVNDRVALYVSIDGPHQGALLPPALQAYMQGLPEISWQIDQIKSQLNALPSRQLLREWVPPVSTPCFDWNGQTFNAKDDLNNCTLEREQAQPFTDTASFNALWERSVAIPDSPDRDPQERAADGLPDFVPAIAISNGLYPPTPIDAGTDKVLRLTVSVDGPIGDKSQTVKDAGGTTQSGDALRPAQQPGGSGFDGVCESQLDSQSQSVTGLGGLYGGVIGFGLGGFAGAFVGGAVGEIIGVDAQMDVWFPMTPGSPDGGKAYPTLVPTESSLLQLPNTREPSPVWKDFFAPTAAGDVRRHTAFQDDQCKFMMYHLAGHMKGDLDGSPSCEVMKPSLSCEDGGMAPGLRLDPEQEASSSPQDYCDCNDSLGHISPFALTLNNCRIRHLNRMIQ